MYEIRFTSLNNELAVDFPIYSTNPPVLVLRPYTTLPTRKVLANPIFLLLNLILQFENACSKKFIELCNPWPNTKQEWANWISASPNLRHLVELRDLDPLSNENHPSVDQLATALVVAGHLRRRLPEEFR